VLHPFVPDLPQKPVCQTKIFFWIAPSIINIKLTAASWARTPKITPRLPATSAAPRKIVKPLLIPMALLRPSGSWKCFHPLVMNTIPIMMRKKKKREISETSQLRKHHALIIQSP